MTLADLGTNFDCASQSEIDTILQITEDPQRIIFANPCKLPSHLQYARKRQVDLMTFDCEEELHKIHQYYPEARLVLRLLVDDSKSKIKFGKKFGCPLDQVQHLLTTATCLNLNVVGLSFHVGSQCLSNRTYYYAFESCCKAYEIAEWLGIKIELIDIGGGFSECNDFEGAAKIINDSIQFFFSEEIEKGSIRFIAEPGRYFAETTHTLVLQVIGKKVVVDDGEVTMVYTLNESVYHSFNCIIFDYCVPKIVPLKSGSDTQYKTRIYGYTCDSIDLILDNVQMPKMDVGDWVYVENFGAYTYSASSNFNGFNGTTDFVYSREPTVPLRPLP